MNISELIYSDDFLRAARNNVGEYIKWVDYTYLQPRTSVAAQARTYVKLRVGTRASAISFLSCVRRHDWARHRCFIRLCKYTTAQKSSAMTGAAVAERAAIAARKIASTTVALAGKSPITLINDTNGVFPSRRITRKV